MEVPPSIPKKVDAEIFRFKFLTFRGLVPLYVVNRGQTQPHQVEGYGTRGHGREQ